MSQLYSQDHVGCAWLSQAEEPGKGGWELRVLLAASEAMVWSVPGHPETCDVRLFPWAPVVDQANPFKSPQIPSAGYTCFPENMKAAVNRQTSCGSCSFFGGVPQRLYTSGGRRVLCHASPGMKKTLGVPWCPHDQVRPLLVWASPFVAFRKQTQREGVLAPNCSHCHLLQPTGILGACPCGLWCCFSWYMGCTEDKKKDSLFHSNHCSRGLTLCLAGRFLPLLRALQSPGAAVRNQTPRSPLPSPAPPTTVPRPHSGTFHAR